MISEAAENKSILFISQTPLFDGSHQNVSNCSITHYKRSVVYVLCLPKRRERADVVVERVWNGNKTTCPSIVACANSC